MPIICLDGDGVNKENKNGDGGRYQGENGDGGYMPTILHFKAISPN